MAVTCKLYQKKSKARPDGMAPVYLLLRINSVEKLISTGKHLHIDHFDNKTCRVKKGADDAMRLNAYLQSKVRDLEKVVLEFESEGKALTHEAIIAAYETGGKLGFAEFARSELEASRKTISDNHYKTTKYQIDKLDAYKPALQFGHITFEFLQRYEYFLVEKGNKPNTIHGDMKMIRKFLNLAIRKGLTKNYPFKDYELPSEDVTKEYLTLKEIEALHGLYDGDTLSERLKGTLGYFLFSCYTGLRFGDVGRVNQTHLKEGQLSIRTEKTNKLVSIPLSRRALRLIHEYENGKLFARPLKQSNSRVNNDLDELMQLAGIQKDITFHCSRHSFAINSLILGIPLEVISDILGHSEIRTTQIYAKIVNELKQQQMNKWNYD